jgi:hypothetical protein
MLSLRCFVFVACVALAAGAACPVDLFMGNWTGTCSQVTFPKTSCATHQECRALPLTGWGLAQGWDGSTTQPPCTQSFSFSAYKVGQAIFFQYKAGGLVAGSTCKNAASPNENLYPLISDEPPYQISFSANDNGYVQPYFGSSAPCFIAAGATPPTATTSNTFLASIDTATGEYKEYGSFDIGFNYVSPGATLNPNAYNSARPSASDWSTLGTMYSNQALTARPQGSPPLAASAALDGSGGSKPVYTYKCSAKKVGSSPGSPAVKSAGAANFASACLLIAALFSVAAF